MLTSILKAVFGTKSKRDLKKMAPLVRKINAIEEEYQKLTDDELRAKTDEFKARLAKGETLDDIMCEAFAAVKNACRRLVGREIEVCGQPMVWDMVPFDVQILGGIALHRGNIAEMATGEGKTLVATMPLYLNALTGKNCQLVTVNDYLALRDSNWMGNIYNFLGLTCGCLQNQQRTSAAPSTPATSRTARTANSVSTTCATWVWPMMPPSWSSAIITTPSSTRSTAS